MTIIYKNLCVHCVLSGFLSFSPFFLCDLSGLSGEMFLDHRSRHRSKKHSRIAYKKRSRCFKRDLNVLGFTKQRTPSITMGGRRLPLHQHFILFVFSM